jgi:integrase
VKKPQHTIIHHNQIWARLVIPADVRAMIGESEDRKGNLFLHKVGRWPMAYHQAVALSAAKVAEWKHRIDLARTKPTIHVYSLATDNPTGFLESIPDYLPPRMIAVPGPGQSPRKAMEGDEPFLSHFDEWQSRTHLKDKTLDQAVSDIKSFAGSVPESLAILSGRHVQGWIETSLETVLPGTVRRKLSALRSYWQWLQSHEIVSPDRKPFEGRRIQDRRTKVEQELDKRQRFEPDDVVRLWEAAAGDKPLHDLVRLAAFTGARREGLASLKTDSVVRKAGIDCLQLREKTEAGVRTVPIHPEIAAQVKDLVKNSKDGFLIPCDARRRGDALGKRFSKLKTDMGFDEHRTFHSLRHTVIHLFREAHCPVEIRNQIIGHEDGDSGGGADYGGHVTEKLKLEWITKAIQYPKTMRKAA